MNAKTAKAIRRAMRDEIAKGTILRPIFHASTFVTIGNEHCVKYKVQYVKQGGEQMVKLAKKIYKISGILPHLSNTKGE